MKNSTLGKIGKYIVGATAGAMALAGVATSAYGNPSASDLRALEEYTKANGAKATLTINGVDQGPTYVLKSGDYRIEVSQYHIMITKDGEKSYVLYDRGRDRSLDSLIMVPGRLGSERGLLEMEAMFEANPKDAKLEMDLASTMKQASNSPANSRRELFYNKDGSVTYNDFKAEVSDTLPADNSTALEMKKFGEGAYEKFISKLKDILGLNKGQ